MLRFHPAKAPRQGILLSLEQGLTVIVARAMTTLLVSTLGGHLSQLHTLLGRFADVDQENVLWVTHDSPQSQSLLAGRRVEFVPYIDERDFKGVARAMLPAQRLIRSSDADLVVSTGSAIAGAFLPVAAALGRQAVFIESAAMVEEHTRTGRLLERVPRVRLLTQSMTTADAKWTYCGSVFDSFQPELHPAVREPKRVVVTVGTSREFGFKKLIERLRNVIPTEVDVLWQTGCTDVSDLEIDAVPWLPSAELDAAMVESDIVISHAGGGSALTALINGKRPVLVPRRADHGEFRDDHQTQIADQLAAQNLASRADVDELQWRALVDAANWSVTSSEAGHPISLGLAS